MPQYNHPPAGRTWILLMPSHKTTVSQTSTFQTVYACWSQCKGHGKRVQRQVVVRVPVTARQPSLDACFEADHVRVSLRVHVLAYLQAPQITAQPITSLPRLPSEARTSDVAANLPKQVGSLMICDKDRKTGPFLRIAYYLHSDTLGTGAEEWALFHKAATPGGLIDSQQ
ncbi:hypothetical protein AC579_7575 [Pseudocercospora musae]|uniref:Uncharacterized protein n=1 Tax=Pseudocercospora musae TaxID=113226 RepID=A0A139I0L7_9PEZI|nr:hypothetical protein AC579_7575 [Pseudocercospora musae]